MDLTNISSSTQREAVKQGNFDCKKPLICRFAVKRVVHCYLFGQPVSFKLCEATLTQQKPSSSTRTKPDKTASVLLSPAEDRSQDQTPGTRSDQRFQEGNAGLTPIHTVVGSEELGHQR
jgi:hypothetical protein